MNIEKIQKAITFLHAEEIEAQKQGNPSAVNYFKEQREIFESMLETTPMVTARDIFGDSATYVDNT